MSKNSIYDIARKAKLRLIRNDYTDCYVSNNSSSLASYIASQKKQKEKKMDKSVSSCENHEDELYKKVCEILEKGNTLNPVSLLIDRKIFDTLDAEGKQFYITNLTQKFKYLKDKYFRTHQGKFIVWNK